MRSWKPLERFRDVFLFFTFAATFLLSACLPQEEEGENPEGSPDVEQPAPENPEIVDPKFLSKSLVDFILSSSDQQGCVDQKVVLVSSDGSRVDKQSIQEAIDSSTGGEQ